jgi:hypothetical protein
LSSGFPEKCGFSPLTAVRHGINAAAPQARLRETGLRYSLIPKKLTGGSYAILFLRVRIF